LGIFFLDFIKKSVFLVIEKSGHIDIAATVLKFTTKNRPLQ